MAIEVNRRYLGVAVGAIDAVGVGDSCPASGSFKVFKFAPLIVNVPSRPSTLANQFPFGAVPPTDNL